MMVTETEFWPGHPLSYTTTMIKVFYNDILLSTATGFVYCFAQRNVLVTNWHVLSGLNPISGRALSSTGGIPNKIVFHVALSTFGDHKGKEAETLHFRPCEIELIGPHGPVWKDSKTSDNQNDFATIDLSMFIPELNEERVSLRAINGGQITLKRGVQREDRLFQLEELNYFYPMVGSDVFILGYPKGVTYSEIFPIWKKASIASEPLMGVNKGHQSFDDMLYVDGLTKQGMSGSPVVYLVSKGETFQTDDGVLVEATSNNPLLVGVYAGRDGVDDEEYGLALGRVWKTSAIEKLFLPSVD